MFNWQELLLVAGVAGVGVLHTMVPDHWAPIALLARQRGWSRAETARAALQAGSGHIVTTLLFGLVVWVVGAAAAERFGELVDAAASLALIAFGEWIAVGAWQEMHQVTPHHHSHDHGGDHHDHVHADDWQRDPLYAPTRGLVVDERHIHPHRHGTGPAHVHWHEHGLGSVHLVGADVAIAAPLHFHRHRTTGRTALLLVLGSSPMVEGIRAFFAASRFGFGLIVAMSVVFAACTIATYVVLSVYSASGLQRLKLGPLERYGEVISGAFIALIGVAFGLWSAL